jgi:hypothetical protein
LAILGKYDKPISAGRELEEQKPGFQDMGARLFCLQLLTHFHALELNVEPGKDRRVNDEERIKS